jgi:hypothetical protein
MVYEVDVADKKIQALDEVKKNEDNNVVNLDIFRSKKKPEDK